MKMLSGLLALGVPAILAAQREPLRQPGSVPTELAATLAAAGGLGTGMDPQILVGELPGWATERLALPTGATVLGSAFMGTTMVGIVQMLDGPPFAAAELEAKLVSKGWRKPPEGVQSAGGFRLANTISQAASTGLPMTMCAGQELLRITPGSGRQGRRTYVYRVSTVSGPSVCNPSRAMAARLPLPTLYHPAEAAEERSQAMYGCQNERPNYDHTSATGTGATIRSSSPAAALLEHYGRQLADSGWIPAGGSAVITQRWTRVDSAGKTIAAELTVNTIAANANCRQLQLMLMEVTRQ